MTYRLDEPDDQDERPQPVTCRECWAPCEDEEELCDRCALKEREEQQIAKGLENRSRL